MTEKEAIEIIKAYKDRLTSSCSNQLDEDICAFDLAIKVLEERPQDEWIDRYNENRGYVCSL